MPRMKTTEQFIADAVAVHGDKYDYSLVEYTGNKNKVRIVCPEHGDFMQMAVGHLQGKGCVKCAGNYQPTTQEFIQRSVNKHGGMYNYSKVTYVNNLTKVCITCPEHGEFWQQPHVHINGVGCPECAIRVGSNKLTLTTLEFITRANKVHKRKYDYKESVYINSGNKLSIICPEHGHFEQGAYSHLSGKGCNKCANSSRIKTRNTTIINNRNWDFEQPEDHKLIPLTQGKFAMVDNEDFDMVKDIPWNYSGGYAVNKTVGSMHRLIMGNPFGVIIDHKNSLDTLDNRRSNLRDADKSTNSINSHRTSGASTYRGVSWSKTRLVWRAYITKRGKQTHVGYFTDEKEAGRARDLKAIELFGEYAHQSLNFPELKEEYLKQINCK